MFGIGRFASAAIMKFVAPARLMAVYCLINILLLLGCDHSSGLGWRLGHLPDQLLHVA